jgi:uncharacterized membrane protein (DUF485 family)
VNAEQTQALTELAAKRWRLALVLTGAMLLIYFGFILLVAFDKPLMGTLILGDRVSVGIVLGALVIVAAPVLTGIYVRWANQTYDAEVDRIRHSAASTAALAGAGPSSSARGADALIPPLGASSRREEARP